MLGGAARWTHFCTLSSLERYWYADDSRGLRTWVLASAVALTGTQAMIALGWLDISETFYLDNRLSWLGAILGGLLFGLGMALVGTCSFGALVRLGSGSLRSLIVVIAIGLAALTTQRGLTGRWRMSQIEPLALDLSAFSSQSIGDLISELIGLSVSPLVALMFAIALFYWVFREPSYRCETRSIVTGTIVGLCVCFGWFATSYLGTQVYSVVPVESASFVRPPGDLLLTFIAATPIIPDYGVGLLLGVVAGSALVARASRDMHWEACDDARELGRHLLGAFFMGTGGVLAAGCTVGQGISGLSTMALSAPIVVISIYVGARTGLAWLIEGRPFAMLHSG